MTLQPGHSDPARPSQPPRNEGERIYPPRCHGAHPVRTDSTTLHAPGGLHHFYEDDPNVAFCGADLTHHPETDGPLPGEMQCVVCYEMAEPDE